VTALAGAETTAARPAGPREGRFSRELARRLEDFPPRASARSWTATAEPREQVLERLLAPPFAHGSPRSQKVRERDLVRVLGWLETQPGGTWQDRWTASGAEDGDWRAMAARWARLAGRMSTAVSAKYERENAAGLVLLSGDVIRPGLGWLLGRESPRRLAEEMARSRDPEGFELVRAACKADAVNSVVKQTALRRIAVLLAAKGGLITDITVGDCLELARAVHEHDGAVRVSSYFYQLLHAAGTFPPEAPPTTRVFGTTGQSSAEALIDRYAPACRPVRDLLVSYLRERELEVDHTTLQGLAQMLGKAFWADLELHHPGIDSLRLPAEVASAWKKRVLTKTTTSRNAEGRLVQTQAPRINAVKVLGTVRAFYLDLAHWAMDDPARWGPWVVPCPIRAEELTYRQAALQRKSRMDQRTRERMPVLPVLISAAAAGRRDSSARLEAAIRTPPGETFTAGGQTLRRSVLATADRSARIWADDPATGRRRDLTLEEHRGFWSWASAEVLRHTGIRVEELTELSHHSLIRYRLPSTGQLIPLLQIAPSKLDEERLLVIAPELADVLSAIVCRIRDENGAVPLVVSFDRHEKVWNPPMPLLFQRRMRLENRPITADAVRTLLDHALAGTGLTDPSGRPLSFRPHDFRRLFITEAIMNGMPPHIAQLIAGHKDINTTINYKAVYPEEVIEGHRAFISRRRALRPGEEYRIPTDQEWNEFLGHFERRRVALGECGRAFGTTCIHEHSCVRCSLLRPSPQQRPRMVEIRDNLHARIAEAREHGWLGEAEGLQVSLAGAEQKIAQIDALAAQRTTVHLGIPTFNDISYRTATAPADPSGDPQT
jgi:integrase